MVLRETLRAAAQRAQADHEFVDQIPGRLAAWRTAIEGLYAHIREWLDDYVQEGTIVFQDEIVQVREETYGDYEAPSLHIRAGNIVVRLRPIGLAIIGAAGRIDMFREGRNSEGSTVRLLRQRDPVDAWLIRLPQTQRIGSAVVANPRPAEPLSREAFEGALDELISSQ